MKLFITAIFACLLALPAFAQNADTAEEQPWDFISFTFVPGVPQTADVFNVYGVKIGVPIGFGSGTYVAGVEGSIFASMSDEVYGVQAARRAPGKHAGQLCGFRQRAPVRTGEHRKGQVVPDRAFEFHQGFIGSFLPVCELPLLMN